MCLLNVCVSVFSLQLHANVENSWNEEEVWRVEMYLSFGIMSLGLLSLLAVTSIPSVNSALNWREFSFIQVLRQTLLMVRRMMMKMVTRMMNILMERPLINNTD